MKILLVCMEHDYGDRARGHSYEYRNFYQSLRQMGHDVILFDFMRETKLHGKVKMNSNLLKLTEDRRPAFAMFSLYTDQFDPGTIDRLRESTKTLCFFHDDNWRVEFSRFWARHFDFFTTHDINGERKYSALGLNNAIHFPFGCNEKIYRKLDVPKRYDVSFVGAWHPHRQWLVHRLEKAGIQVEPFGHRWPKGMVSTEDMVSIFNQSRINLNLSNSVSWDIRYLASSPRALLNTVRSPKNTEQLKGRHFEINGCGAFQLSYYVEGLEKHYDIGKEIGIFTDPDDLIRKTRQYLADEKSRESIAIAGLARTLKEHTFSLRFKKVFARMGLQNE